MTLIIMRMSRITQIRIIYIRVICVIRVESAYLCDINIIPRFKKLNNAPFLFQKSAADLNFNIHSAQRPAPWRVTPFCFLLFPFFRS